MRSPPAVLVGNDVVDLLDPRTFGKAADARFVGRVLDAAGRAALQDADNPDLELWCRWAAKEAAYKVISKLAGTPPPFAHRAFAVRWEAADDAAAADPGTPPDEVAAPDAEAAAQDPVAAPADADLRRGVVRHEGRVVPVSVCLRTEGGRGVAVHALASSDAAAPRPEHVLEPMDWPGSPWTAPLEELRARFTERELDAVRSYRSAAVRLGARAFLAQRMGIAERRIEIVCDPGPYGRRPPRVLMDGGGGDVDVSLSHDGRWIAWAAWLGRGGS